MKDKKLYNIYRFIKYLVVFLLIFGIIGDFFSPTFNIIIHFNNFIIGGLIYFVCWYRIRELKHKIIIK